MIYIFRVMFICTSIYLYYLLTSGFGAGMEPVWGILLVIFAVVSIRKIYVYFIEKKWFKTMMVLGITFIIIVESMIIYTGVEDDVTNGADYVIVLGAGIFGERVSLTLKYRLEVAYDYLMENEQTRAVLSGGQGEGEEITEAEAMYRYLLNKGIEEERLIKEEQSRNTRENIRNSYVILNELEGMEFEVDIITSRFHVLRSRMIANEEGHQVGGVGSKTLLYLVPNSYFRELFAVVVEFIR